MDDSLASATEEIRESLDDKMPWKQLMTYDHAKRRLETGVRKQVMSRIHRQAPTGRLVHQPSRTQSKRQEHWRMCCRLRGVTEKVTCNAIARIDHDPTTTGSTEDTNDTTAHRAYRVVCVQTVKIEPNTERLIPATLQETGVRACLLICPYPSAACSPGEEEVRRPHWPTCSQRSTRHTCFGGTYNGRHQFRHGATIHNNVCLVATIMKIRATIITEQIQDPTISRIKQELAQHPIIKNKIYRLFSEL
ncbi:unnamed protein product [Caenorhabditis bovis]|uniref:Uncharacterized protein n=1 Tax=Caenorhabditis bovis TaxID=2654633 RepID=A0A8S1F5X2_9PELO|nr:unnamed protein product [Caenorhabditis bovis]